MTLWFASANANKKKELAAILGNDVLIPSDAGMDFDPEETGSFFCENALLKARALHTLLNQQHPPLFTPGDPIIADDSGICVDALNGRPGIYSARYAGPEGLIQRRAAKDKISSAQRNALLLEELGDNPLRTARFVCAMVLMFSPERFYVIQETCEGKIVKGKEFAQGTNGFGYDPIMYIPALGRTMAELSEEEKNTISHRGKAGILIAKLLTEFA